MNYRAITPEEIATMQRNGCRASDWNNVKVKDGFNPECYVRVNFSGDIYLGVTDEPVIGTAGSSHSRASTTPLCKTVQSAIMYISRM